MEDRRTLKRRPRASFPEQELGEANNFSISHHSPQGRLQCTAADAPAAPVAGAFHGPGPSGMPFRACDAQLLLRVVRLRRIGPELFMKELSSRVCVET